MKKRFGFLNKNILLWALYDFANTPLLSAVSGLYLAQWLVLENKLDDIWYGGVFSLSTILILVSSPFLGAWSDKIRKRMPFLKWSTYLLIISGALLGFTALSSLPTLPKVILVLVFFFFVQYFYQASLIFYNSLLRSLSTSATMGKVSGFGQAVGEIGWLVGTYILLLFSMGKLTLFGNPGRAQVFLPAVIILALLGLPMMFWFREPKTKNVSGRFDFKEIYKRTIAGFSDLIKTKKNTTRYLIAFMLISDALLTANLYFALFLDQVYHISDFQKYIVILLLEIMSITFAYISGRVGDKIGIKKILVLSGFCLSAVYIAMSFNSSMTVTYALAILVGLGYGGFYTSSRVFLAKIAPPNSQGEYFGFFSTFQKFASIIGPLTWGIITLGLKDCGVIKYRVALFSLSTLMLIGTLILLKVREQKDTT